MHYIPLVFAGLLAVLYLACSIAEVVLMVLEWYAKQRRPGILILARNPGYLRILERWFQQEGFKVWATADQQLAEDVVQFNAKEIDLALLDVGHDGADGEGAVARLRRTMPFLPCCFMGSLNEQDTSYLYYLGAIAVFDKPLLLRESTEFIREVIKRNRARA